MPTVTQVLDMGEDTLEVHGLDDDGNEIVATGWLSAMTNYFPPASYDAAGNLTKTAKPRAMTAAEKKAYWLSLLGDTATAAPAEPVVLFSA